MLQITTKENLTNDFILQISDDLFTQTLAYRTFGSKKMFADKINDFTIRYKMLDNIVQIAEISDDIQQLQEKISHINLLSKKQT